MVVIVGRMRRDDVDDRENGALVLVIALAQECPVDDVGDIRRILRTQIGRGVSIAADIDKVRQGLENDVLHVLGGFGA